MGRPDLIVPLISGGVAGVAVDVLFYPFDTLKTRLQSASGFRKAGGFRNIYKGIGPVSLVSFPHSAVFFWCYELTKISCKESVQNHALRHVIAACTAEIVGNLVRVPAEVVKQRAQATKGLNSYSAFILTIQREGFRGLYRGYLQTIARDVPFSIVQFTTWEKLKYEWGKYKKRPVTPFESGIAGAVGAALSSFVTTPLDVAKTRVILAEGDSLLLRSTLLGVIFRIGYDDGIVALFKGGLIRVSVYSVGGIFFFFVYEQVYRGLAMYYQS